MNSLKECRGALVCVNDSQAKFKVFAVQDAADFHTVFFPLTQTDLRDDDDDDQGK